jgi:alpha-L-rhamnosidase
MIRPSVLRLALLALAIFFPHNSGLAQTAKDDAGDLNAGFAAPPDSALTHTWWHWMDGTETREGITADLEAMHRVGIHSATIISAELGIPHGPVKYMSPEWLALVKFAAEEAKRLGMTVGMGDDAGWSSSGGPWMTPEYTMQMVVESEQQLTGPSHFSGPFPQPETREGYYRDIQIIAYPTSSEDEVTMESLSPKITGSDAVFDGSHFNNGKTFLPVPTPAQPQYVQFEFTQSFAVRSVKIAVADVEGHAEVQVSDDGHNFRTVQQLELAGGDNNGGYVVATVSARFFRVVFTQVKGDSKQLEISNIELSSAPIIDNYRRKADYGYRQNSEEFRGAKAGDVPPDTIILPDKAIDLTQHLDKSGNLDWQVPPGKWTVLRFGYTPTGAYNHPAWGDGRGLECDKLSRPAAKFFWDGIMPRVQETLGPLVSQSFDHILIDSYEVGSQNWTPAFREEFKRRRGYDMFPFLPVLAGHYVKSPEETERFLWDFRRTIADLFAENYYDYFAVMCHQVGIKLEVEPYGDGPFEDLRCARDTDCVMGEFWWPDASAMSTVKLAANVAHVYGKSVVGAESFTSEHGQWDMSPPTLKALGDLAFVNGVNSYHFHRFVEQPWPNRAPGLTLGPYGSTLERTNNWWDESGAWEKYLARCNFLLQKGLFVADLLYSDDEGAPATSPAPNVEKGYAYDCTSQDALLNLLSVKDGKLVLPDGMSYRVLVLPSEDKMTPVLLRKLKELVDAGATIVGPKPEAAPGLVDYPQSDAEVKSLSTELWDSGKIISNKSEADVLHAAGVKPDFQCDLPISPVYIHRVTGDTDIYFISNQKMADETADCIFRVTGKVPELWHADTGEIEKIAVYSEEDGRTRIPIHLDPAGSVFVLFRPQTNPVNHAVLVTRTGSDTPTAAQSNLVIKSAIYGDPQGVGTMDVAAQLTSLIKEGGLAFQPGNGLFGKDPSPDRTKVLKLDYVLNGKEVNETLNENANVDILVPHANPPDYVLNFGNDGALGMQVWKAGSYQIKMSGGDPVAKDVSNVGSAQEVSGSWDLKFPPNWGAPAQATFDKLISWSDSADSGVKYFSGTATYNKTLQISAEMLGKDRHLYLDLGDVQVIAQVKLNGEDLGTLWKAPYRVEITPMAKAGDNVLEIKVTNLWPNRLIGDEHLPEDCEWKPDGSLQKFPQWLLDGKPSPTGRFTFASHKHFTKDSPLFPSGLIGPVTLVPSVQVSLP